VETKLQWMIRSR